MFQIQWPKTMLNPLTDEEQAKIDRCLCETQDLVFKPVVCLICKTHLFDAADNMDGYVVVKCHKCKAIMPVNPSYFKSSEYMRIIRNRERFQIPLENFTN